MILQESQRIQTLFPVIHNSIRNEKNNLSFRTDYPPIGEHGPKIMSDGIMIEPYKQYNTSFVLFSDNEDIKKVTLQGYHTVGSSGGTRSDLIKEWEINMNEISDFASYLDEEGLINEYVIKEEEYEDEVYLCAGGYYISHLYFNETLENVVSYLVKINSYEFSDVFMKKSADERITLTFAVNGTPFKLPIDSIKNNSQLYIYGLDEDNNLISCTIKDLKDLRIFDPNAPQSMDLDEFDEQEWAL